MSADSDTDTAFVARPHARLSPDEFASETATAPAVGAFGASEAAEADPEFDADGWDDVSERDRRRARDFVDAARRSDHGFLRRELAMGQDINVRRVRSAPRTASARSARSAVPRRAHRAHGLLRSRRRRDDQAAHRRWGFDRSLRCGKKARDSFRSQQVSGVGALASGLTRRHAGAAPRCAPC
jgi:hypothetical protein